MGVKEVFGSSWLKGRRLILMWSGRRSVWPDSRRLCSLISSVQWRAEKLTD